VLAPRTRPLSCAGPGLPTVDLDEPMSTDGRSAYVRIGESIDGLYTVLDVLGSGGMGTVYRARDEALGRDVAIKLIHEDLLDRPRMREAFLEEARAMARLRHHNVVTVHAFGQHDGRPYLVMERVAGPSLSARCREQEPPTRDDALTILEGLCNGVQAIHETGALHGDLKPGNVLLDHGGRVAVSDFGLSRAFHLVGRNEPRFAFGTPGYLAPELAREERLEPELATSIDIYALGVIAFELLTGRPPFEVRSVPGLLTEHAYGTVPRPSTVSTDLPAAFDDVLLGALAKFPAERTRSAKAFRRALLEASRSIDEDTPPIHVLVVDDEPGALSALRELLLTTFPRARVTAVTNTKAAAEIAIRERPDVVITDLHMPDGGGLELTTLLRAHPTANDIPIIVITGLGGARDWHELRALGADRFLVKPIDFDALVAVIRSLLASAKT
jgi:eukaryotic-like serine/threonine-protein kinase